MKHVVMGVPPGSDYAVFQKELPSSIFDDLKAIMGWKEEHDHLYDFQLSSEQVARIEELISEKLPSAELDLFLTCNE